MTEPTYPPEELPAHDRLADDCDQLDWNVGELGRMRDFATGTDGEPTTVEL